MLFIKVIYCLFFIQASYLRICPLCIDKFFFLSHQKEIDIKMRSRPVQAFNGGHNVQDEPEHIPDDEVTFGEAERAFRGGAR